MHQDFDDLGARAFHWLSELVAGHRPSNSVSTPTLVLSDSSGPYHGET